MHFSILTDVPVWVRPLADSLRTFKADVKVARSPKEIPADSIVVNRISTRVARKEPRLAESMKDALQQWEAESRSVINGARCLELGFSKLAQAELFQHCGVRTPRTVVAVPGERHMPESTVLLKPAAGGFGRGILRLKPGEIVPESLDAEHSQPWIEQEAIKPIDGAVHRLETLGGKVLYEASSPIVPDCFDYCLAHASEDVTLRPGSEVSTDIQKAIAQIMKVAGMELGSVEYLVDGTGKPVFIDLNPVSSYHPEAARVLKSDPITCVADYLVEHYRA